MVNRKNRGIEGLWDKERDVEKKVETEREGDRGMMNDKDGQTDREMERETGNSYWWRIKKRKDRVRK